MQEIGIQLDLFGNHQEIRRSPSLPYALELLQNREPPDTNAPLVVSYGGGRNSTAMLIGMWSKGIIPDLILFADTGGEVPETYKFIELFSDWLVDKKMPKVTVVSREQLGMNKHGRYQTLEGQCFANAQLPGKAFGNSECSLKWKVDPQEKFVKIWTKEKGIWGNTLIRTAIGYHAGEISRLFNRKSGKPHLQDKTYFYEYPMILWGWYQGHCEAIIAGAGLPIPPKSSCYFCPNRKAKEIRELAQTHPELAQRAIEMEKNAAKNLTTVKGLGRRFSWEELLESSKPNDFFTNDIIPDCMCNDG